MRLAYPFNDPNNLGVFAAVIASYCSGRYLWRKRYFNQHWDAHSLVWAGCAIICGVLISLSASRGSLVGAMSGSLALAIIDYQTARRIPFDEIARVTLIILGFLLNSNANRVTFGFWDDDYSTINRIEMLKCSVGELVLAPTSGIGWRESGPVYYQWFQPPDSNTGIYEALLCAPIALIAELGWPVFAAITIAIFYSISRILSVADRHCPRDRSSAYHAIPPVATLLVSLLFYTPRQPIAVYLAVSLPLLYGLYAMRKECYSRGLAGASIGGLLCLFGWVLASKASTFATCQVSRRGNHGIVVTRGNAYGAIRICMYIDEESFGVDYGRCIRSAVQATQGNYSVCIHRPGQPATDCSSDLDVCVGNSRRSTEQKKRCWVINPPDDLDPSAENIECVVLGSALARVRPEFAARCQRVGKLIVMPHTQYSVRMCFDEILQRIVLPNPKFSAFEMQQQPGS